MHYYRAISNTVSHLEVLWCERINTAKQKHGLTSFLYTNVSEAPIFHCVFLDGQNVWENNTYWSSTERNVVIIYMSSKPEFLVAKDEMLAAFKPFGIVSNQFYGQTITLKRKKWKCHSTFKETWNILQRLFTICSSVTFNCKNNITANILLQHISLFHTKTKQTITGSSNWLNN